MTPTTPPELTQLDSSPGSYAFYSWSNIMIACWSKSATGPAMQRMTRLREEMDGECPEGVSVVYLIADGAGLPDADARAEATRLMERFSGKRACLAVVVYGQGFWVSAMRAAVIGVRLLTRRPFPMEIFGSEKDAVGWLRARHERHTGRRIDPGQLSSVLQHLAATL